MSILQIHLYGSFFQVYVHLVWILLTYGFCCFSSLDFPPLPSSFIWFPILDFLPPPVLFIFHISDLFLPFCFICFPHLGFLPSLLLLSHNPEKKKYQWHTTVLTLSVPLSTVLAIFWFVPPQMMLSLPSHCAQ